MDNHRGCVAATTIGVVSMLVIFLVILAIVSTSHSGPSALPTGCVQEFDHNDQYITINTSGTPASKTNPVYKVVCVTVVAGG